MRFTKTAHSTNSCGYSTSVQSRLIYFFAEDSEVTLFRNGADFSKIASLGVITIERLTIEPNAKSSYLAANK